MRYLILAILWPSLAFANHENVVDCDSYYCKETDPNNFVIREWTLDGWYEVRRFRTTYRITQSTYIQGVLREKFTLDFHTRCYKPQRLRYSVSTSAVPGKQEKTWRYNSQCKLTTLLTYDTLYTFIWKQDGAGMCTEHPIGSEPICQYHPYF
jgi:hypothetical protein